MLFALIKQNQAMEESEKYWDVNEPMAEAKLDDYDPLPLALRVEQTIEGEIPSRSEDVLKTALTLSIPEVVMNVSQDNESNVTSPIVDNKKTKKSIKELNKEPNIPKLKNLFREKPEAPANKNPIKKSFFNSHQQSVMQNVVAELQIPSENSLIDSSQSTTSRNIAPIEEERVDDPQNSNFPFPVETRVVESMLNQVNPPVNNPTVLQFENLVPNQPINEQIPTIANMLPLSQETNNPSLDGSQIAESSSQSNNNTIPMIIDEAANRGVKRSTSSGSKEEENAPPSKKSKEMDKYKHIEETHDEKNKLMIYNRIRNFLRHSQRERGYVELQYRNFPPLALTKNILVLNTYYPFPKPEDKSEPAKAMRRVNGEMWVSMMLDDEIVEEKVAPKPIEIDLQNTQN